MGRGWRSQRNLLVRDGGLSLSDTVDGRPGRSLGADRLGGGQNRLFGRVGIRFLVGVMSLLLACQ